MKGQVPKWNFYAKSYHHKQKLISYANMKMKYIQVIATHKTSLVINGILDFMNCNYHIRTKPCFKGQ